MWNEDHNKLLEGWQCLHRLALGLMLQLIVIMGSWSNHREHWMRRSSVIPKALPNSGVTLRHSTDWWEMLEGLDIAVQYLKGSNYQGMDYHRQHIFLRLKAFHRSRQADGMAWNDGPRMSSKHFTGIVSTWNRAELGDKCILWTFVKQPVLRRTQHGCEITESCHIVFHFRNQ